MRRAASLVGVVVTLVTVLPARAHDPRPSRYTWWRDVRPILERHCAPCHAQGGAGPMPLVRYEEVLPWTAGIQREVLERRMPPWPPEAGHVDLRGERLLGAREVDILAEWITGAAPEGDPEPAVATRSIPAVTGEEGALRVEMGPVRLGPDEAEKAVCRVVEIPVTGRRWIGGVELRPGEPRSLRRAVIWKARECDDARAPLFAWVPGQPRLVARRDSGEPIGPGDAFAVRLEYRKTWDDDGYAVEDASELLVQLETEARRSPLRRLADGSPIDDAMELVALTPGTPEGSVVEVEARRPGEAPLVVLELRRPDRLWLGRYELTEPLRLPAGSTLHSRGGRVFAELLPLP